MNLKEIGINTRNWVDSAEGRYYCRALVNAAQNLRVSLAMELVKLPMELKNSICFKIIAFIKVKVLWLS